MERNKLLAFAAVLLIAAVSGCISTQTGTTTQKATISETTAPETATVQTAQLIVPYTNVMVQDVKEMIDNKEDILILDVRTEAEFAQGSLNGAVNIPDYKIEERYKELNANKDKPIVVICAAGVRSKAAAEKLSKLGFTNVYNMLGGMNQWWKVYGKTNYG